MRRQVWKSGIFACLVVAAIFIFGITAGASEALQNPTAGGSVSGDWKGSYVYFGRYRQLNGDPLYPVKWRVLQVEEDNLLLMSDRILSYHAFGEGKNRNSQWDHSDVRDYMNQKLIYEIFTPEEIEWIADSHVAASPFPWSDSPDRLDGGSDTIDKLFLPSYEDVTSGAYGFGADEKSLDCTRKALDFYGMRAEEYWLRTSGRSMFGMHAPLLCSESGHAYAPGVLVGPSTAGVRPMLRVSRRSPFVHENPEDVITYSFTLNANGGYLGKKGTTTKEYKVNYNSSCDFLETPDRRGYTFVGWYTEKYGGNRVESSTKAASVTVHTLYAHWKKGYLLEYAEITVKPCTYNGEKKTPAVTVKLNGKKLKKNTDYSVSYSNNINASSKAKVKIKGKGKYKGSATKYFVIERKKEKVYQLTRTNREIGKYFRLGKVSALDHVSDSDGAVATLTRRSGILTVKINGAGSATSIAFPKGGNYEQIRVEIKVAGSTLGVRETDKKNNIPMKNVYNAATGLAVSICKDKIPQALCKAGPYLLISLYGNSGCFIVVLDEEKGEYWPRAVLALKGSTPIADFKAHVGGLTYDGKGSVWLSGRYKKEVLKISLNRIDSIVKNAKPTDNVCYMKAGVDYEVYDAIYTEKGQKKYANPSFLAFNKTSGLLYVGNFSEKSSGCMKAFMPGKKTLKYMPEYDIPIPEQIQGAVFDGGKGLFLSQSYGTDKRSKIFYFTRKGNTYTEKKVTGLEASMSEGLELVGGKLYVLFESSARKYTVKAEKAGLLQDRIWILDTDRLK